MSDKKDHKKSSEEKYKAPEGSSADLILKIGDKKIDYKAETQWIVLRKEDKPKAEMFYTWAESRRELCEDMARFYTKFA